MHMDDQSGDGYDYPELDVDGAYVSEDGYYTCESCDVVLEATGNTTVVNGWKRSLFACPSCEAEYPCY